MFFLTSLMVKLNTGQPRPLSEYEALLPVIPFRKGLQHNIFQTNKTKEQSSAAIRDNIRKIQDCNPGWNYSLFDDADIEDYIGRFYGPVILSYYKRIDPSYGAAKADFFRYLVIYREGGIYLDIKSSPDKPLDEVVKDGDCYLLSYWNNAPGDGHEGFGHYPGLPDYISRGEIIQWYIAASAGHPLLRLVIATVLRNIDAYNPFTDGVGWTGTMKTTGPIMYTKTIYDALAATPGDYPVQWVDIIKDCGFRYSIFEKEQGENPSAPSHTAVLSSDYRKASVPLIRSKSATLSKLNKLYLSILRKTHK